MQCTSYGMHDSCFTGLAGLLSQQQNSQRFHLSCSIGPKLYQIGHVSFTQVCITEPRSWIVRNKKRIEANITYWHILGSLMFLLVVFVLNIFGARSYGEAEYWFSLIKVLTILIFIIVGCCISGGLIG